MLEKGKDAGKAVLLTSFNTRAAAVPQLLVSKKPCESRLARDMQVKVAVSPCRRLFLKGGAERAHGRGGGRPTEFDEDVQGSGKLKPLGNKKPQG